MSFGLNLDLHCQQIMVRVLNFVICGGQNDFDLIFVLPDGMQSIALFTKIIWVQTGNHFAQLKCCA